MPRKGQVAGFAYFTTEEPMLVTPAVFRYVLRNDVGASVTTLQHTVFQIIRPTAVCHLIKIVNHNE